MEKWALLVQHQILLAQLDPKAYQVNQDQKVPLVQLALLDRPVQPEGPLAQLAQLVLVPLALPALAPRVPLALQGQPVMSGAQVRLELDLLVQPDPLALLVILELLDLLVLDRPDLLVQRAL